MIRKLRARFVLINMTLISVVLLFLLIAIGILSYRSFLEDSLEAMRRTSNEFRGVIYTGEPVPPKEDERMTVFCVWIDGERDIGSIRMYGDEILLKGTDLENAIKYVFLQMDEDVTDGIMQDYSIRWRSQAVQNGTIIAFVDRSNEIAVMSDLIRNLALIGIAALAAFLAVSIFFVRLMLRPVEQAWERQRQFFADASHELKTPLTVILANTEILQGHENETIGSQKKWFGYIKEEAERMRLLVEDMLFLAKSDTSRNKKLSVPFDMSDTLMSCMLSFESIAFEKGINMESDIEPDVVLNGDPAQFRQLCTILLDNACKYTDENGNIDVTLSRSIDRIRLSVSNTGIPIPKESLPRLFERFYRADSSRTREEGGAGLGLAIAEQLVKNMRGKITVDSDISGTVFTVTIPSYLI